MTQKSNDTEEALKISYYRKEVFFSFPEFQHLIAAMPACRQVRILLPFEQAAVCLSTP